MGSIEVVNIHTQHIPENCIYFYIGRNKQNNILGNPYTHITNGTLAEHVVSSRGEAIAKYESHFDVAYRHNENFKKKIDEIYNCYSHGENVLLGCFCKPKSCHGDIIKKYIEMRFLKEKFNF